MAEQQARPRVAVIGTGGSISIHGRHSLDLAEYGEFGRVLEVDELLARFPETAATADLVPIRFRALRSTAVGPRDWLELNELIHRTAETERDLAGIAITHGTATLEETAYFLNLVVKAPLPIVVVGAQRPPTGLSTDAALNLVSAIRVAGAAQARGLGVLTLLNNEIQAARDVTKAATYSLQAFRSPDTGPLGYVEADGSISIYRTPVRRRAPDTEFEARGLTDLPRVDIAYSYSGSDGAVIEALVARGARGIVVAGMAPGMLTPGEHDVAVEAIRRGVIVVLSTRAGSGRVLKRSRLREKGIVAADNLNPQKARVLTMLALTKTSDHEVVQRMFDEY
jgi:L-asparaginase